MHIPYSRIMRVIGAVTDSPARYFWKLSLSMSPNATWLNGDSSLPYQTLVMPLILSGRASLALKKACQSAGVASLIGVQAKQCINVFSPAMASECESNNAIMPTLQKLILD